MEQVLLHRVWCYPVMLRHDSANLTAQLSAFQIFSGGHRQTAPLQDRQRSKKQGHRYMLDVQVDGHMSILFCMPIGRCCMLCPAVSINTYICGEETACRGIDAWLWGSHAWWFAMCKLRAPSSNTVSSL